MRSGQRFSYLALEPEEIGALRTRLGAKTFDPKTKGGNGRFMMSTKWRPASGNAFGFRKDSKRRVLFKNGDLPKIVAIDTERVTFEDGRSVANDFLHVDQAHCVTGYSTERRTVDIYIGLAPMTSLGAVTATDVYVGHYARRAESNLVHR
jgi:hypothetical protein